ncbi:MAG: hypothetical protein R3F60_15820 [bacterium]
MQQRRADGDAGRRPADPGGRRAHGGARHRAAHGRGARYCAPAAPVTEAPLEAVTVQATLSDQQQQVADRLVADILANRLNRLATRSAEYGPIFLSWPLATRGRPWSPPPRWHVADVAARGPRGREGGGRRLPRGGAGSPRLSQRAGARAAAIAARLLVGEEVPDEATLAKAIELLKAGTPADRVAMASLLINVRDFQLAKPAKGTPRAGWWTP